MAEGLYHFGMICFFTYYHAHVQIFLTDLLFFFLFHGVGEEKMTWIGVYASALMETWGGRSEQLLLASLIIGQLFRDIKFIHFLGHYLMYSWTFHWSKFGLIDFFRNNNISIYSPVISSPGLSWLHFNSQNKHAF